MTSTFKILPRPPPIPISKTCIFKTVSEVPIYVDVYLPPKAPPTPSCTPTTSTHTLAIQTPLLLFIHGGGWTGSNREDYSRPLFQHFLNLGFTIASMDYRLVPESSNLQQLEDVKDVERWLRDVLPREVEEKGGVSNAIDEEVARKVVVVGASAGGQLALLVPKLWQNPPIAMLILYSPTDMHNLPYSGRGRLSALTIPPATHELLTEATDYVVPPTQRAIPKCALDYLAPRVVMSTHVFRSEIIAELLLRGLTDGNSICGDEKRWEENGELRLPEKGCVDLQEINAISPLHYLLSIPTTSSPPYPPTYLITGTTDEVFAPDSHSIPFYQELIRQNVPTELRLVPGLGHAFDIWAEVGGVIGEEVLRPAVDWIWKVTQSSEN